MVQVDVASPIAGATGNAVFLRRRAFAGQQTRSFAGEVQGHDCYRMCAQEFILGDEDNDIDMYNWCMRKCDEGLMPPQQKTVQTPRRRRRRRRFLF